MNAALEYLSTFEGVTGVFLHRGGIIKWQRLPDFLTNDQAAALCSAVNRALGTYTRAERRVTEAYFEFAGSSVLVVTPGPGLNLILTILLRDRWCAPAALEGATNYFAGVADI